MFAFLFLFLFAFCHCKSVCKFDDFVCGRYWIRRMFHSLDVFFVFMRILAIAFACSLVFDWMLANVQFARWNTRMQKSQIERCGEWFFLRCVFFLFFLRTPFNANGFSVIQVNKFKCIESNKYHSAMFMANSCRPNGLTALSPTDDMHTLPTVTFPIGYYKIDV